MTYILAIDQGTTSTRAMVFDSAMGVVVSEQKSSHSISQTQAGSNTIRLICGGQRLLPAMTL